MIDDPAALGPVPPALVAAYAADRFRDEGHRLIELLADHLGRATGRDDGPVIRWQPPAAARAAWPADFPEQPAEDLLAVLGRTVDGSIRLHHPRYLGHQVPPPLPAAALVDALAALLNNGMAVYEMGGAATPMEAAVIDWMARTLGLPAGAGGVLTSGGSAGNLTALLAARQARAGFDVWTEGAHAGPPLAVLVAATAHYSIGRAVRALGWGDGGAIAVAVDDRHRMRPDDLPRALELGYRGTSHKNCKGIVKGLANAALLRMRPDSILSGEDLCSIGPVAMLQDLAVQAALGVAHVERNGHHYLRGLSVYPEALQRDVLVAHRGFYQLHAEGFPVLRIEDGQMDVRSVNAAPFGCGAILNMEPFEALDAWIKRGGLGEL